MELLFLILALSTFSFITFICLGYSALLIGRGLRKVLKLDKRKKQNAVELGRWKHLLSGGAIALFMILNDLTETNMQLAGLISIFVLVLFLGKSFLEWRKDKTSLEYMATLLTGIGVAAVTFPFYQFVLEMADRYIL